MIDVNISGIASLAIDIYGWTIVVYILLSWFQGVSWAHELRRTLEPIVEPYINLFRAIVPRTGALDFSPLVALLVLQYLVKYAVLMLLRVLGL